MTALTKQKKDIITLVIGKVVQVVISIAAIKILTEMLTVEEVGNYYLLMTMLTFFNFTFLNPLGQYYGRHIITWEKSKNLLNATVVLICIRALAIFTALFFAYGAFSYFGYDSYYGLLEFIGFIFIALLAGTQMVFINAINTLGDRVVFIKNLVLTMILGLLCSVLIVSLWNKSGMNWLYGISIAQLICLIPTYRHLVQKNKYSCSRIKSALSKGYIRKALYFIIPITITLFLQWGQNVSYRLIVEVKYSIEILAFMAVGLSVSSAIFSAVEGLATQYFNPLYLRKISHASKELRAKAWNDLVGNMVPIYIMLTAFVIALSPYLVKVLVATKFHEAYTYAMVGALIEFFRVITNLVYMVSQSEVKTNTTILPYAIGTTISIGILYITDFGAELWMIPVVLSTVNGLIFMMLFLNMRRLLAIKFCFKSIGKSLLLSLPFIGVYFLPVNKSYSIAFTVIAVSGLYFLISLYVCKRVEGKSR